MGTVPSPAVISAARRRAIASPYRPADAISSATSSRIALSPAKRLPARWPAHASRGSISSVCFDNTCGLVPLAKLAESHCQQVAGFEVIRVVVQGKPQVCFGGRPVTTGRVHLRQCVIRRRTPGQVPGRLVQRCIRLLPFAQVAERQTQMVVGLAVVRVGVERGERSNCRLRKCSRASSNSPAPQVPDAHGIVASRVARIAPQRLLPVQLRVPRGMAILAPGAGRSDRAARSSLSLRRRRLCRGRGHLAVAWRRRRVAKQLSCHRPREPAASGRAAVFVPAAWAAAPEAQSGEDRPTTAPVCRPRRASSRLSRPAGAASPPRQCGRFSRAHRNVQAHRRLEVGVLAGPIFWIGYQYWLHVLVSPGWRNEKSGWLSV